MKKIIAFIAMSIVGLTLIGCGGGDSGSTTTTVTATETGIFIDAPVEGLSYSTPTISGYTNALGEFQYKTGEIVTFKIGHFVLGSAVGGKIMTPLTLTGENDLNNISVKATNIARLLQTLDANTSDQGNIEIPVALHDLNVSNINLENESDLNILLSAAQQMTSTPYVLKDTISAKNEMKTFIQLYSQYELYQLFQNAKYYGGSTQYYKLNMPNDGTIDFTLHAGTAGDAYSAAGNNNFAKLYDINQTYIKDLYGSQVIPSGNYIVKISGLSTSSYMNVYSIALTPSLTLNRLTNAKYYGGSTQYYKLNMPNDGTIDFTLYTGTANDAFSAAGNNNFAKLYDINQTYIKDLYGSQVIPSGNYIVKISGLSTSSYMDVYSPLLN